MLTVQLHEISKHGILWKHKNVAWWCLERVWWQKRLVTTGHLWGMWSCVSDAETYFWVKHKDWPVWILLITTQQSFHSFITCKFKRVVQHL